MSQNSLKIAFITPAPLLKRLWLYRQGGKLYGQSNSITGPLILGGILKRAGHEVRAYEELNGKVDFKYVYDCDVVCIYTMTSGLATLKLYQNQKSISRANRSTKRFLARALWYTFKVANPLV